MPAPTVPQPETDRGRAGPAVLFVPAQTRSPAPASTDTLDRRLISRAEAALAGLTPAFLAMARSELDRLQQALEGAWSEPARAAKAWPVLADAALDLKGIGGTFGYPLVSRFAQSLCHYLQGEAIDPPVVQAHLEALRAVHEPRVPGDGRPLAHRIGRALDTLVAGARAG